MSAYTFRQSKQLRKLRKAIMNRPPYCSGTVPVQAIELSLFYGEGERARQINFNDANDVALKHLVDACKPAIFGRNNEDVFDESYRKAGELDQSKFAVKLKVDEKSLLMIVHTQLLEGRSSGRRIEAELYKLNVYGEGLFFKSHKDTPRGGRMFGSLVVIYPTRHEGGSLVFRDGRNEWTFDSAQAVATSTSESPRIGYAAFFSDVEHAVTPVQTGYRVTVTYNLYFVDDALHNNPEPRFEDRLTFRAVLEQLLSDPTFLPKGGRLGFGLRRAYPVEKISTSRWALLDYLRYHLKGSDAEIMRACEALSLRTDLYLVYRDDDEAGLVAEEPYISTVKQMEEGILHFLREACSEEVTEVNDFAGGIANYSVPDDDSQSGVDTSDSNDAEDSEDSDENAADRRSLSSEQVQDATENPAGADTDSLHVPAHDSGSDIDDKSVDSASSDNVRTDDSDDAKRSWTVHWVTMPSHMNVLEKPAVHYGNEASIDYTYGYVTLIVEVGKSGKRETKAE
ncbi:hypothetical protein EIP86_000094 [Pleurotus ostreatoroseus]|nr:hypothetical protein EIP86_000094 [Pleurotus ostreatoroseus]